MKSPSLPPGAFLSNPLHLLIFLEVEGEEETASASDSRGGAKGEAATATAINLRPANAYEFGQALSAARGAGDAAACADLLASTDPEALPRLLSTQLDGNTVGFVMRALDSHLLERDPALVYRHLDHLHTADRFSVRRMWNVFGLIRTPAFRGLGSPRQSGVFHENSLLFIK